MIPEPHETWATDGFDNRTGPQVFIQWKGTDVCLDFTCQCGAGRQHFDGYFAYGLRCSTCGTEWTLPHTFGLLPAEYGNDIIQDTGMPHDPTRPTTEVAYADTDEDED